MTGISERIRRAHDVHVDARGVDQALVQVPADAASVFTTPTRNGYRRRTPFSLAPNRSTWGLNNRAAMLRVQVGPGDRSTHVENRVGEPAANPSLYLASQLVAGMDDVGAPRVLHPVLMGRALVLVHDAVPGRGAAEVGTVGPALDALGFDVTVATLVTGARAPDPEGLDVVVVLGAAESAYDDTVPWLGAELELLARVVEAGTPVLGICFGAQVLARVLGGRVGPAPRSERGFVTLDSADPDLLEPGTWMEFHNDAFTLPPGATPLARNEVGLQAFTLDRHLAVQFHPEITPEVFAAWSESWVEHGIEDTVAALIDLPALRAEIAARAPEAAAACRRLVTRFCAHAGVRTG